MRKARIAVVLTTVSLLFFPCTSIFADDTSILEDNQDPGLGDID
ncbi:hypothetical protein [Virgibacillus oceani]|uniref:Phosphatase n=1 Tax=Virgibacillus oceani TaxID=1479511 RepID=A0A917HP90_9BACI|nr:hypothetical protein [Virgibacillus oceani]GGG86087.1 hypothetical protein GCM10011398_34820 [Virgibacillus oceani]